MDIAVARIEDLALVQPAPAEHEQLISIGTAGHLIALSTYQGPVGVLSSIETPGLHRPTSNDQIGSPSSTIQRAEIAMRPLKSTTWQ